MGKLIGWAIVAVAAIPIVIGIVIFAPVVVVLILLCMWAERNDA